MTACIVLLDGNVSPELPGSAPGSGAQLDPGWGLMVMWHGPLAEHASSSSFPRASLHRSVAGGVYSLNAWEHRGPFYRRLNVCCSFRSAGNVRGDVERCACCCLYCWCVSLIEGWEVCCSGGVCVGQRPWLLQSGVGVRRLGGSIVRSWQQAGPSISKHA